MKFNCSFLLRLAMGLMLLGLLGGEVAVAQSIFYSGIQHGKKVLHDDGTQTESVKDMNKGEITETTFDSRGTPISKKTFQVNRNGDPIQGVIHDGAGNLIAKVLFGFDDLGRLKEERCVNTSGEVFRRVIHQYDAAGQKLRPLAYDFKVNAPNMKVATLDFTGRKRAPERVTPGNAVNALNPGNPQPTGVVQPGGQPQIMSVSPSSGYVQPTQQQAYEEAYRQQQMQQTQMAPAQTQNQTQQAPGAPKEEKKRRFWPFGKKDK
ncbi:hypothetical protein FEM03_12175 [Phragmitibacter flavus]|uniref:Uncharacterized protein n=1 Tax=Phragmitibacter flavus TaxID=2576071 RepID=A0A5R8KFW5_9BACT|nr:hypothetical protein [Phragmitibacter flavus]TLD70479.1 hypothetical protein FEM03_12175 [Phragmitibacter flavus]